jgi:hypothetical protein
MRFVVEVEGYGLSVGFCLKECSILNLETGQIKHFFVKPSCRFESLSSKDRRIVGYTERSLHKINWEAGCDRFHDVVEWMERNLNKTDEIYTKGGNKKKFIEFRLAKGFKVPSLKQVVANVDNEGFDKCPLSFHDTNPQCTHLKVQALNRHFAGINHESLFEPEQFT